jgi:predicted  nucleic acid-binding Zn-ribbon protein
MIPIASLITDLTQLKDLDARKRRIDKTAPLFHDITLAAGVVRERLPTAILKHYDLRVSRGKLGAATVRNGTCGGCHLSLPCGQLADLRRDDVALQVCGYCSIFLLPEDPQSNQSPPTSALKPVAKAPAKRKVKAAAPP